MLKILWRIWGRRWIVFEGLSCRTGPLRAGGHFVACVPVAVRRVCGCERWSGLNSAASKSMRGCDRYISIDYVNGGSENVWIDRRAEAVTKFGAGVCGGGAGAGGGLRGPLKDLICPFRSFAEKFASQFNALFGWGGRIRTSVWRNQNPLPYHLATPQPPWQVIRNALHRQQDRWRTFAILASRSKPIMRARRGWSGYRPVRSRERSAQPRVAAPSRPERGRPRGSGRLPFPGYFPVTGDFPGFWQ